MVKHKLVGGKWVPTSGELGGEAAGRGQPSKAPPEQARVQAIADRYDYQRNTTDLKVRQRITEKLVNHPNFTDDKTTVRRVLNRIKDPVEYRHAIEASLPDYGITNEEWNRHLAS